jgi:hypothetical protein
LDPECQEIGAQGVFCTDGIIVTATSSDVEKQLVRQRLARQQAIKNADSLRIELPQGCSAQTPDLCAPDSHPVQAFFDGVGGSFRALVSHDGKESCLLTFAKSVYDGLNLLAPSATSFVPYVKDAAAAVLWNKTLNYAASRQNFLGGIGLLQPNKSSVFRRMSRQAIRVSEEGSAVGTEIMILGQGLWDEGWAATHGQCR